MRYDRELKVALEAVVEAAQLCQAVRAEMVVVDRLEKADRSPVTVADFGSQALVCRRLQEEFPEDPIVAEEDASALREAGQAEMLAHICRHAGRLNADVTPESLCDWIDSGNGRVGDRFWTLDPIDGTKGFLRNDQYAVALALVEDGNVKVGVLGVPSMLADSSDSDSRRGVLFTAVRGRGTRMGMLDGSGVRDVRVTREPGGKSWRFAESVEAAHSDHDRQMRITQAAGISASPLRMDSQAKYGAVARGDAVLYLRLPSPKYPNYREKIWDHAAGSLAVEEAGGRVTDMHGQPLDFGKGPVMSDNRGVVVSNGEIHVRVLEGLQDP